MGAFSFKSRGSGGFVWTASEYSGEALEQVPYVELWEYEQTASATLEGINNWMQVAKNPTSGDQAYKGLYIGKATGNTYVLPFLTQYNHQIGQNWQENQGSMGNFVLQGRNYVENVAKALYPSAGILFPKSWSGVNETSYPIEFNLINTVKAGDWVNNLAFLKAITRANLHHQDNALVITPPCIYEALIPGVRWSPAAVISQLTIENMGSLNMMSDGGVSVVVPDAWRVIIYIRELINESQNLYDSVWSGTGYVKSIQVKVV